LKIAFVAPFGLNVLPPYQLSGGIWIYEVARRLGTRHDVWVYSWRNPLQAEPRRDDVVHYRFLDSVLARPTRKVLHPLMGLRGPRTPYFASALANPGYSLAVVRDILRQHFDAILADEVFTLPVLLGSFSRRPRVAFRMRAEWLAQFDRSFVERRIRSSDLVLGCSRYVTEAVRRRFPEYADRCLTVYEGVDQGRFAPLGARNGRDHDPTTLLFVGRVSPEKGLHTLLDAFYKVLKECPDCKLQVVGQYTSAPLEMIILPSHDPGVRSLARFYRPESQTAYRDYLLVQAQALGIRDRVSFSGPRPYEDMPSFYRCADVLVNPSFVETFGRSLIEGMACGLPVVATRVGGMPEIVDEGRNGLMVDPGDSEALSQAILKLVLNPRQARSMGLAGRKKAIDRFAWDVIVPRLLEIIEDPRPRTARSLVSPKK